MPYSSPAGLPQHVKSFLKKFPPKAANQWISIFNSVLSSGGTEEDAFRKATGRVRDQYKNAARMIDFVLAFYGGVNEILELGTSRKAEEGADYYRDLPDAAHAVIEPGYVAGHTQNRNARHYPHHDVNVKGRALPNGIVQDDGARTITGKALVRFSTVLRRMGQAKPMTNTIDQARLTAIAKAHMQRHIAQLRGKATQAPPKPQPQKPQPQKPQPQPQQKPQPQPPAMSRSERLYLLAKADCLEELLLLIVPHANVIQGKTATGQAPGGTIHAHDFIATVAGESVSGNTSGGIPPQHRIIRKDRTEVAGMHYHVVNTAKPQPQDQATSYPQGASQASRRKP